MNEIFDLIFSLFGQVITWLKQIPVWENVSLYDFSIAILIMSIVVVAFVPIIRVGSTSPQVAESVDNIRFKKQTKKDIDNAIQAQKDLEQERGY